ncbi:MAG TPA: hypothetical protein VJX29_06735 [Candidatus Acidoferrales bacterium]|nr:hypothetical protein [Candidatus Acidoferrales bacterium]
MRDLTLRCSRCGFAALIALFAGLAAGCHSGGPTETVTVSPGSYTVALQGTAQFVATVTGAADTTVTWQVDGVTGGNSTCGTISTSGLYTAPNAIPNTTTCSGTTVKTTACTTTTNGTITLTPGCILITAISNQNNIYTGTAAVAVSSGVAISISPTGALTAGTSETLQFEATITGTTNLTVNWLVNSVQGGDLSTTGSITSTTIGDGTLAHAATFTAPAMIPTPATVTIEAQAAADTTQFQTVTLTVVVAADPTLTSVSPLNAPAGAYAQDFYLSGANFLSTTSVLFGGVNVGALAGGSVTAVNATLLRAHVPSSASAVVSMTNPIPFGPLAYAGTSIPIQAQRQNGTTTPVTPNTLVNLVPVRPVLLGVTPGTITQNSPTTTVELDGGYYTPSTFSEFNGHLASTAQDSTFPRTLQAILSSSDLTEAGLFPIAVRTPDATPPRSAINLSIRPTAAPAVSNTITGFKQPVAIALNDVTGVPVVVDQGKNALDLLDTGFTTITSSVTVGTTPTSVAVDGLRNFALVADNGSSDVAVVDLSVPALAGTPLSLAATLSGPPVAVGVDEIHGRAIVVGQNVAAAVVLDTSGSPAAPPVVLGTVSIVTGTKPQVTVLPELGWAIVTPGGAGQLSVVDLLRLSVVFSSTVNSTLRGVGINTETKTLILADPTTPFNAIFSLLDQSISTVSLDLGSVAAAANPLTNVGLLLNPNLRVAFELDLSTPAAIAVLPLGSDPIAVAIDPGSDKALVVDDVDANVSVIDLGATRSRSGEPQILSVNRYDPVNITAAVQTGNTVTITTAAAHGLTTGDAAIISSVGVAGYNGTYVVTVTSPTQFTYTDPTSGLAASGGGMLVGPATANAFVSSNPVPLVVLGAGFTAASQIRVNETPIATAFDSSRPGELTGSIPASLLTQPVRLVVDVQNSPTLFSNVRNLLVGQPVAVGNSPLGVAIGSIVDQSTIPPTELELALVVNSADGTVSVADISPASPTFGTVTSLITVGSTPVDVGIVSRNGLAAVSNSGASTASIVDLTTNPITVPSTASVGAGPTGVAANQSLGSALVTNTSSNSISLIPLSSSGLTGASGLAVDAQPVAAAIAPDLDVAVVADAAANDAILVDVASGAPSFLARVPNITAPTGVDYDPVTQDFLILSSASNTVTQLNVTPTGTNTYSLLQSSIRVGVNPTSLAYNFQSGTLLTLNTASNTLSIVDLAKCITTTLPATSCTTTSVVRDVLPFFGTVQYALAIHPWLGYFVLSDSANNRILILPMPR